MSEDVAGSFDLIQEERDYVRGGQQKDVYAADEVVEAGCPLCGSTEHEKLYTEHGSIGIVRCRSCTLIYVSPRILSPEAVYWGDASKYLDEARLVFSRKKPHHRDPNYLEELELVHRYKPAGKLLDVGCNMGFLARHAMDMGYETIGVEPSASLAGIAEEKNGVNVLNCFLNEVPDEHAKSFDVVTLSDVFEHITDPLSLLGDVRRLIRNDGVLYVKVPNGRWNLFKQRALEALRRKPKSGVWDSYEHVVHYTDETLRAMLEKGGFEVLELTLGKPIQTPVWHELVGAYYQYPTPLILDWKRQLGRSAFYWAAWPERALRGGSIGAFAPNLVAVARPR